MTTETKGTPLLIGSCLVRAYTLNSMYANNKIQLEDTAGTVYRIDVEDVLKALQDRNFIIVKKTKYHHLKIV